MFVWAEKTAGYSLIISEVGITRNPVGNDADPEDGQLEEAARPLKSIASVGSSVSVFINDSELNTNL